MGSIAKFHRRQILSKNAAYKFKYQDNYLQESIFADTRAKSYAKEIEKQKQRNKAQSFYVEPYEKGPNTAMSMSNYGTLNASFSSSSSNNVTNNNNNNNESISPTSKKENTTSSSSRRRKKHNIKNPTLLAKKRALAWKRKQQKEEQEKMQIHNKKWYHVENRPLPTVGDIESVKARAKLAIKKIKDERERKEKMDKIKYKKEQFKKKLLYSEAQRIISDNVGKFEKGSYIIRTEDRRKPKTIEEELYKPTWQPTGYYNDIESTQNTKKMEDSYDNKPGIFRTFSYP